MQYFPVSYGSKVVLREAHQSTVRGSGNTSSGVFFIGGEVVRFVWQRMAEGRPRFPQPALEASGAASDSELELELQLAKLPAHLLVPVASGIDARLKRSGIGDIRNGNCA